MKTPNAPTWDRASVFCTVDRKKPAAPVVNDIVIVLLMASFGSKGISSSPATSSVGSAMVLGRAARGNRSSHHQYSDVSRRSGCEKGNEGGCDGD